MRTKAVDFRAGGQLRRDRLECRPFVRCESNSVMSESRLLTLRDYIRWAGLSAVSTPPACSFGHGTDNAWDEARHLVLGPAPSREISDSYLDCRLEDDERAELAEILRRRIEERIPAAYLLGEAWFCGILQRRRTRVLALAYRRTYRTALRAPAAGRAGANPRPLHRFRLHRYRLRLCVRAGGGGARRPVLRCAGGGQRQYRAPRPRRAGSTPSRATVSPGFPASAST